MSITVGDINKFMDKITNDLKQHDFPPISEQKAHWETNEQMFDRSMQLMDAMIVFFDDMEKATAKLKTEMEKISREATQQI
jgi:hypothetical protein